MQPNHSGHYCPLAWTWHVVCVLANSQPDKLRQLLTLLYTSMTARQQRAIGHILIGQIPRGERITDILLPRRGGQNSSILPAQGIWAPDQVEKNLSHGTDYNLVPAVMIRRSNDGTSSSPSLRWVWRSNLVDRPAPTSSQRIRPASARTFSDATSFLNVRPTTGTASGIISPSTRRDRTHAVQPQPGVGKHDIRCHHL